MGKRMDIGQQSRAAAPSPKNRTVRTISLDGLWIDEREHPKRALEMTSSRLLDTPLSGKRGKLNQLHMVGIMPMDRPFQVADRSIAER